MDGSAPSLPGSVMGFLPPDVTEPRPLLPNINGPVQRGLLPHHGDDDEVGLAGYSDAETTRANCSEVRAHQRKQCVHYSICSFAAVLPSF